MYMGTVVPEVEISDMDKWLHPTEFCEMLIHALDTWALIQYKDVVLLE